MTQIYGSPRRLDVPRSRAGRGRGGVLAYVASLDLLLVLTTIAISSFGVLMIASATRETQRAAGLDPTLYMKKQAVFLALGMLAMIVTTLVDYRSLLDLSPAIYAVTVVLLIAVLFTPAVNGAHSWFEFGQFQLQPSEFAKLVLILTLAAYGGAQRNQLDGRRVGSAVALAGLLIGLILLEPDLGSALVFGVIFLVMLWVAGAERRHFMLLVGAAATVGFLVVRLGFLASYQVERLTSFVGKASYNVEKSKVAIGSGGLTGRGLFAGTQTRYGYVPARHTDFIFSVVGEQLGFVGAALLILAIGLLCFRILRIAAGARDTSGSLICVGVLALFVFQTFENIGMTMQIMPVTGIPLPLVSYGGSSTIMECVALGLVLNVGRRRFR